MQEEHGDANGLNEIPLIPRTTTVHKNSHAGEVGGDVACWLLNIPATC